MVHNYRKRVYGSYVSGRDAPSAPATLEDLGPRLPQLRRIVRRYFPESFEAPILDLGCGYGALLYVARQAGYRSLRGVDASREQVALAASLGIEGVELGDVKATLRDLPPQSLDCLIAFDLLEHFDRNELLPLVDDAYRTLKQGGRWIIHAPNAESPFGMRIRYGDLTHELAFTRTSIGQLLLSSGFSRLDFFEDQPIPHGLKSSLRWLLWQPLRGLLRLYIAIETGEIGRRAIFSQNLLSVAYK